MVVITGARIVDDGASGGGGGGGDGCQWGKKSLELNGVERATAGGNCYTPFPLEFDPNGGKVYAKEGANDARCQQDKRLQEVTSKASKEDKKNVANAVMSQFQAGQGWGVVEGKTTLKVIYADGGVDFWELQESFSAAFYRVLDIVRSIPGNGQVKPRTTPCG